MTWKDRLYRHCPVWAQNLAVTGFGAYWHWLRFGPGYREAVEAYEQQERYRSDEWTVWQRKRLKSLLRICAEEVPYYRDSWSEGEKRSAIQGDLSGLPILGKEILRRDPWAVARRPKPGRGIHVFHTSGSTGTPIASIWTTRELRNSLALREVRSARWAGASFSMPRATFSGRMVEPNPNSRGPFHRYNAVERQCYLSAFHLSPATAQEYVRGLWECKTQWLTGYAVSYYLLAKLILEQRLEVPPLKAIVTTSEKATAEMRQVMERAFKCRVFEEYSTVENAVFASECEMGRLHVSPDSGIVEILRPDGSACVAGEVGEVVATCLMRDFQPLVRFKLGDMAAWSGEICPCGREMPVLQEIVGRLEDVVVGPDGRQLVRFHGIFVDQPNIIEGQIIQEAANRIRAEVVGTEGFCAADVEDVRARILQRLGAGVHVDVERVESIPRTSAGKFKAVVSLMNMRGDKR